MANKPIPPSFDSRLHCILPSGLPPGNVTRCCVSTNSNLVVNRLLHKPWNPSRSNHPRPGSSYATPTRQSPYSVDGFLRREPADWPRPPVHAAIKAPPQLTLRFPSPSPASAPMFCSMSCRRIPSLCLASHPKSSPRTWLDEKSFEDVCNSSAFCDRAS